MDFILLKLRNMDKELFSAGFIIFVTNERTKQSEMRQFCFIIILVEDEGIMKSAYPTQ